MACGVPVITSNTSSLPEIVGDAGLLLDPSGNTDVWATTICNVLVNKNLRNKMVLKGIEQAKRFSWEKTARITLEAFEKN
jgi:glycosyltransferase involved in cell wall biosynthesis